jgi:RNA polymerase sigma-70 factor (ECF subfamily)
MTDPGGTRPSLLIRIRDARDADAWNQFVALYGPLVYRYGRKYGLQDADADDLAQAVLQAVAGAIQRLDYDPRQGSFRGWLFQVVRNQLRKLLARRKRAAVGSGDTHVQAVLEAQPAPEPADEALWQEKYQEELFRWAARQVRPQVAESSWQAFWLTAVEGKSAREIAPGLGMTVGAVYTAKSRVLNRIREVIQRLEGPPDRPEE